MMRRLVALSVAALLFPIAPSASAQDAATSPAAPAPVAVPAPVAMPAPVAAPSYAPATNTPSNGELTKQSSSLDWLIFQVGAGVSSTTIVVHDVNRDQHSRGASLFLDVGLSLNRYVGVGAHFGKTSGSVELFYFDDTSDANHVFYRRDYNPLEVGIFLSLHPIEHVWVAPWIGTIDFPVDQSDNTDTTQRAYGALIGGDLATGPRGTHRFGGYLSFLTTDGFSDGAGLRGYTLGLSYRYK